MSKELWEQSPDSLLVVKGVMLRRSRRMTKGRLQKIYKERREGMSPKLNTEVREGADDVNEGIPYEITNVEEIITEARQFSGIRVSLLTQKAEEGNVVLWQRKVTGTGSKLGVFITALGNDTDKWLHKWVVFDTWQDRNRVLSVVPAPAEKPKKVKAK